MYTLKCSDMGIKDCAFEAEGETKEEVVELAMEHALRLHPKEMAQKLKNHSEEEVEEMMGDTAEELDL